MRVGVVGAVLGLKGGMSEARSPAVSGDVDLCNLVVKMSIRCLRTSAMVSSACSRACLYWKCGRPDGPRCSVSWGSR